VTKVYLAMERELLVASEQNGGWLAHIRLEGLQPVSLAADPLKPNIVYSGTFRRGLWRSDDAGASWRLVGDPVGYWMRSSFKGGITHPNVMAVAVSATERVEGHGIVYAGTEL
jgi:hypothetical protein